MRRTHAAAEDLPESISESTVALIARLSAEHDVPPVGALGQRRHSRDSANAVVSQDAGPGAAARGSAGWPRSRSARS